MWYIPVSMVRLIPTVLPCETCLQRNYMKRTLNFQRVAITHHSFLKPKLPETLNRIERGRTTPDFKTIRKLVVAMNAAEADQVPCEISEEPDTRPGKEPDHGREK